MIEQVRFTCPQCRYVLQTGRDKVGYDIACPNCAFQFKLVEPPVSGKFAETSVRSDSAGSNLAASGSLASLPVHDPAKSPPAPAPETWRSPVLPVHVPTGGIYQPMFTCPYCGTHAPPYTKSKVSTVGWIIFAVFLITTCFFCWVGLLIRDTHRFCSRCNNELV
jgi:transcription elongation factor Elf1